MKNKFKISKTISSLLWVLSYTKPDVLLFLVSCILSMANMSVTILTPYVFKDIITIISENNQLKLSDFTDVVKLLAIVLLSIPVFIIGTYFQKKIVVKAQKNLRKKFFDNLLDICYTELNKKLEGNYITLLTNDIEQITKFLNGYTFSIILKFIILFPLSVLTLLFYDWRMLVIGIVLSFFTVLSSILINPVGRKHEKQSLGLQAESTDTIIDLMNGHSTVRIYNLGDYFLQKYNKICQKILKKQVKARTIYGANESIGQLGTLHIQILSFLAGVFLLRGDGVTSMASLVFSAGYVGILGQAIQNVNFFLKAIQSTLISIERIQETFAQKKEDEGHTEQPPDYSSENAIEFRNVAFAHNDRKALFSNLSFAVKRGEHVLLSGPSGAGKTTIFMLLMKFYEITNGEIRLFGRPLEKLSRKDIRGLTACVFQDGIVFNTTIYENIQWGNPEAAEDQVYEAAGKACIHEFIISLPAGYNTMLSNNASILSGGQKQRITIARAFLKNAPILLLDEFTASLDIDSDTKIVEAISNLKQDRTVLIISHRENIAKNLERVILIPEGITVEHG